MAWRRIENVVVKEWRVTFGNLNSALFITLLPLIITAQALAYIYLAIHFGGQELLASTVLQTGVGRLERVMPELARLSATEQLQVFFYQQIPIYLLLIPAMVANSMATFSIVEEKQTGTLEPLLATPVRTWELLLGKALAGAVPANLITWICAGLFLLGVIALGSGHLLGIALTVSWFISLFLLAPLVTILSFLIGVIASSRASDAKSAQNLALLIVLPILALVIVQLVGLTLLTPLMLAIIALALAGFNLLALRGAALLFQRESILLRWK